MGRKILYEPWGLGDACIAAAITAQCSDDFVLACRKEWHSVIDAALQNRGLKIDVIPTTTKHGRRDAGALLAGEVVGDNCLIQPELIYSIRGDYRDWLAVKKQFPGVPLKMRGGLIWIARKLTLLDLFISSLKPVRSRYQQWLDLVFPECGLTKLALSAKEQPIKKIVIHVGAQWKSKQYPFVLDLATSLEQSGFEIALLAGLHDHLPDGVGESKVMRLQGPDLVKVLSLYDLIVTNDSGPMHVSFLMGAKVLSIFGTANAKEWAPPGVEILCSSFMPKGYAAIAGYTTDQVLIGWPTVQQVAAKIVDLSKGVRRLEDNFSDHCVSK